MSRSHRAVCATLFLLAGLCPAPAQAPEQSKPAASSIPADNEHATQALKDSPRHGEWVDIALPSSGTEGAAKETKLHTWIVYPERNDKAPVVIVIHEIFGLTDWVRVVADQLAAEGFIAVAPDLLSGMGPNGGGTESLGEGARDAIRKLSDDETARRLNAAMDHAVKMPSASESVACIGFCWGGSASFAYPMKQSKLKGAVVYYGTAPMRDGQPDTDALSKVACPVIGLYGGDDNRVTSTVEPTAKAMEELKKPYTHHIYEGAGHGFLRQQTGKDGANLRAAQAAWTQTIAFLKQNLK